MIKKSNPKSTSRKTISSKKSKKKQFLGEFSNKTYFQIFIEIQTGKYNDLDPLEFKKILIKEGWDEGRSDILSKLLSSHLHPKKPAPVSKNHTQKKEIKTVRDFYPSIRWKPSQDIGYSYNPSELESNVDEFDEKIIFLLNQKKGNLEEIKDSIEHEISGFIQCKHLWTKEFIKGAKNRFKKIVKDSDILFRDMDIFRDEGLLLQIQDELMRMDKKGKYPYGANSYIESERFLTIFQNYLLCFQSVFVKIIKKIDEIPASVLSSKEKCPHTDNTPGLLKILIYELLYIFENHHLLTDKTNIKEYRIWFTGMVLYHYGIEKNQRAVEIARLPEINEAPPQPKSNRLVRYIIDEDYKLKINIQSAINRAAESS